MHGPMKVKFKLLIVLHHKMWLHVSTNYMVTLGSLVHMKQEL